MALKKTEAIILRQRDFGNTSLIFTFYTLDHGKIECLAKGIKKKISRGEGGMEIFSRVELIYYEKEARSLRLLSHSYILNSFKSLRASLLKLACASYFLELVNRLIHGEEKNEKIYYLLLNSLLYLEHAQDINKLIHFFEVKLIGLLGYGLSLVLNPAVKGIIRFLEKADFEALSRLKISEKHENHLQAVLQNYIRTLLDEKPLNSSAVLKKMGLLKNSII